MLISIPLWLTERDYPLLPLIPGLPALPAPWDKVFFGVLLLSLVLAFRFFRSATGLFLAGALFSFLSDQNRGQPWLYMYWIMLLLALQRAPAALVSCRVALSGVYVWGGIQKLNSAFQEVAVPWFVSPASDWLPSACLPALRGLLATAPFVEIFIGLGLWIPSLRRPAIVAAFLIHLSALLFLGPLGHSYNFVVWPWNVAMLVLVLVLFPAGASLGTVFHLRRAWCALTLLVLFWLLPIFSYSGHWPSYFSFALYSANLARAEIYLGDSVRQRLPESMQCFVRPLGKAPHPRIQGPYLFDQQTWAMAVLGAAPWPEPGGFQSVRRYLTQWSSTTGDLRMVVASRGDAMLFYEGENSWRIRLPAEEAAENSRRERFFAAAGIHFWKRDDGTAASAVSIARAGDSLAQVDHHK
jgi:hypothetical protein